MTIMKKYNYSGYSALSTSLDEAIAALETAKKSGKAFVDDPANAQVKTCIDKIQTLDDELNNAGTWVPRLERFLSNLSITTETTRIKDNVALLSSIEAKLRNLG